MVYYTNKLFEKVLKEPAASCNKLVAISGYSSASFLKKFINEFPNHSIILMIGMATYGISEKNHDEFKKICKEHSEVKVMYRIGKPANHMKIYQWYLNDNPVAAFTGSANFTEMGFQLHQEVMVPIKDSFQSLLEEIAVHYIDCCDSEAAEKIPLYKDEYNEELMEINEASTDYSSYLPQTEDRAFHNRPMEFDYLSMPFNLRKSYISLEKLNLELILKNDLHWDTKGLNEWNRPGRKFADSYINVERSDQVAIGGDIFFPRNEIVTVITDDNQKFSVKRTGPYGKKLKIVDENTNFYEYFVTRLGKTKGELLSLADFENYGSTSVNFYKKEEDKFLLEFLSNDQRKNDNDREEEF